jgi:hypothetical protein
MIARIRYYPNATRVGFPVEHLLGFSHVFIKTENSDSMEFDFTVPGEQEPRIFMVSQDGSAEVYIMNNGGNTVDSYKWPVS